MTILGYTRGFTKELKEFVTSSFILIERKEGTCYRLSRLNQSTIVRINSCCSYLEDVWRTRNHLWCDLRNLRKFLEIFPAQLEMGCFRPAESSRARGTRVREYDMFCQRVHRRVESAARAEIDNTTAYRVIYTARVYCGREKRSPLYSNYERASGWHCTDCTSRLSLPFQRKGNKGARTLLASPSECPWQIGQWIERLYLK